MDVDESEGGGGGGAASKKGSPGAAAAVAEGVELLQVRPAHMTAAAKVGGLYRPLFMELGLRKLTLLWSLLAFRGRRDVWIPLDKARLARAGAVL